MTVIDTGAFSTNSNMFNHSNYTISKMGVSPVELWINHVIFFGIIGGMVSPAGNALIAMGIIRDPKLRTRFFTVLLFLVITRTVLGLQMLIIFLHRTLRTLNIINTDMSRIGCYFLHIHVFYTMTLESIFLLGLVVDRILAIVLYNYYRSLTHKQASLACIIATLITIPLKLVPSFFGVNFKESVACLFAKSAVSLLYTRYSLNIDLFLALLILTGYIGLIVYVRFRLQFLPMTRTMQMENRDQRGLAAIAQHRKLLPVLTRLVFIHCGISLTVRAFIASQNYLPVWVAVKIASYAVVPTSMDYFINIIVLLLCDQDLRKAAFSCFTGRRRKRNRRQRLLN